MRLRSLRCGGTLVPTCSYLSTPAGRRSSTSRGSTSTQTQHSCFQQHTFSKCGAAETPHTRPTHAPHTPHTSHRERADTEILLHLYSTLLFLILGHQPNNLFLVCWKQPPRLFERCEHERHVYELCQYKDYKKRVKAAEDAK